ncbi:MAG: tRNA pseudouridine(38-40) synthase TruA [Planctomycetes bacterium]|nr:tRNA pseudouridine(38-40) synthase TruA [Planctomycetota bacterium]
MPRYKLTVAYEGTEFHGWQKQHPPGAEPLRTVQEVLERAVMEVVREPVVLHGASRTDSGVHARGQIAAFTTTTVLPLDRVAVAINARLPDDVQITRAVTVAETFDPIADAISKGYRYSIFHGLPTEIRRPMFDRRLVTYVPAVLDPGRMHAAAAGLVGTHDFASVTRVNHGRESTTRTVLACSVTASTSHRLRIDVSGTGFLYNMVRIIAGTLVEVGRGRLEPGAVPEIIARRDRTAAGPTMPPEGLCLMWVRYGGTKARRHEGTE